MAVDQDIIAVFAANDGSEVQISNTDPIFKYRIAINRFCVSYRSFIEKYRLISEISLFRMRSPIGLSISNVEYKVFVINTLIESCKA